mgnify:CR=1 FL=1
MKIEPQLEVLLPQLELRVLHGPQAGSRLTLSVGEYMLGTDDDCEVMLAGPRLMGVHARLRIDTDAASISPIDGTVLDGHGKAISQDTPLALGMPVEIGGIWVSVDEVDAPWPSTETLIPQPVVTPLPESSDLNEASAAAPSQELSVDHDVDVQRARVRARRILIVSLAGLAMIGILGVVGTLWLSQQAPPVVQEVGNKKPSTDSRPSLSDRLAEAFPGRTIRVSTAKGGPPVVTAYASDRRMATQMQQLIRKHDSTSMLHIFIDEEMQESVRTILEKYREDGKRAVVQVSEVKNGVASIRGIVISASVRDELIENLKNSVSGLRSVDTNFQSAEDLSSILAERLVVADLSNKLKVVSRQPEFVLRGSLSEDEIQRWEKLFIQFTDEFGQLLPIRTVISVQQKRPPINVQTVVGGPMPFIITDNGQRIGVGGEVNGHTITSIRDDEIVFDGTQRYRISR